MLQIGESSIHIIFAVWVVFMEAIFSGLNVKLNYRFLRYSVPEVLNNTGYGLADIYDFLIGS